MGFFNLGDCHICHKKIWRFAGSFRNSVEHGKVHTHCWMDMKFEQDKRLLKFLRTGDFFRIANFSNPSSTQNHKSSSVKHETIERDLEKKLEKRVDKNEA